MGASFPILQTKLNIPRLRANWIRRARLTARLDEDLAGNLFVISAPAGYGKTTLLAEWMEHRQRQQNQAQASAPAAARFAWLWLDEADNDPARFMSYLLASLRRVAPGLGEEQSDALQSLHPSQLETVLVGLINEVAALPQQIILILDDYHSIQSPVIHAALGHLAEHLPPNLALVIASRSDPPLPLTRLRARGLMLELRQEDLRFSTDEAIQFLNQAMGLDLTPEQATVLEQRTEGWVAGLQMAAVSLRGREDIGPFLDSFSGSHRFVLDYLLEEVMNSQPVEIRSFLLQTSILDRLCAPLCAAVIEVGSAAGRQDPNPPPERVRMSTASAQAVLELLERSNLFIVPLDDQRRWYRYHHLFAELLRQQLDSGGQLVQANLGLPALAALHQRACAWYASQSLLPEAIQHSLAAQDFPAAVELIVGVAEDMLRNSEWVTLQTWLNALPEEVILERPDLCLYHALVLVPGWKSLERVNPRLQRALAGNTSGPLAAATAALDSLIACFQGDYARGIARSGQALALMPDPGSFLGSLTVTLLGISYLFNGDIPQVRNSLDQALELSLKANNLLATTMLRGQIGDLFVFEGHLHQANDIYQETLRQGVDQFGNPLPIAGMAYLGLGEIQREWNDLDQAETLVTRGLDLIRRWGEATALDGYIALARIKQAQGDLDSGRAFIEQAASSARQFDVSNIDDRMVGAYAARLLSYQGDLEGARRWLEKAGVDLDHVPSSFLQSGSGSSGGDANGLSYPSSLIQELEYIAAARLLILLGRPVQALETLNALLSSPGVSEHRRSSAEILILMSVAHSKLGADVQALRTLERSVELSAPEGFIRLFVDEAIIHLGDDGDVILVDLLKRLKARANPETGGYIDRLLQACPAPPAKGDSALTDAGDLLSGRELEVLYCLAAGMSNEEIAGQLTVAVSTVKSHVHHILNKLNASSRLAAVQSAREAGLLK